MLLLKSDRWWNFKIPPMLAMAYYAMLSAPAPPPIEKTVAQLALFLVAVIGIAGFGHLFLDIFDVEEDRIRGQSNMWADAGPLLRALGLAAVLAAAWLPWLFIPIGKVALILIAAQFLTFALYALPPVRLKTRGLAGIVADGMYAHALPALWTWIPFAHLSGAETPIWMGVMIGIWGISVGMRDMMHHQAIDAETDRSAGATTYGARRGRSHLMRLLGERILPLEVLSFAMLLGAVSTKTVLPAVGFAVYVAWSLVKNRLSWLEPVDLFAENGGEDSATVLARRILSPFYYGALPVLLVVALAARDTSYLILLTLHLLIFRRMISQLLASEISAAIAVLRSARRQRLPAAPASPS